MQTLQIDKSNARKLFPSASPEFKQMLLDTFGEKFFQQKITERVKTFQDACDALGIDPYSVIKSDDSKDEAAYKQLKIIASALNEGWMPDWNDANQAKWYPYFKMSGFGFWYTLCVSWNSYTIVGSRLCFKSSDLAEYAGKQFLHTYQDFLTLQ
jgi:hypothetical protein